MFDYPQEITMNVPYEDLMRAPTHGRSYTSAIGVAIPPEMAAPAGSQLLRPESPGFPLRGARPVLPKTIPQPIGVRDERTAPWSAPVPDLAADLDQRVARATPSPTSGPTRRPSSPAPAPFGSARIPNGGGRADR